MNDQERPDTVLFVGRIIPRKGAFELVKAIEQIRRKIPDLQLRMAGGPLESQAPGYMAMIEDYVRTHDLSRHVTFLGQVSEDDMFNEYASCALVALPARQETAPMAIQEAMAAGKAVVSTGPAAFHIWSIMIVPGFSQKAAMWMGWPPRSRFCCVTADCAGAWARPPKRKLSIASEPITLPPARESIYYQVLNRPVPAIERASPARQLVCVLGAGDALKTCE